MIGKEASDGKDGYWLETSANTPVGDMVVKVLTVQDGGNTSVTRMIMQMAGRPATEMPEMGRMQQKQSLDIRSEADKVGSESVSTPAGDFTADHYRMKNGSGDFWVSEKVSPYGLIKYQGKDMTMVLTKVVTGAKDKIMGTPVPFNPATDDGRRRSAQIAARFLRPGLPLDDGGGNPMSDKSTDHAAKQKLGPTPESCIIIDQPLVRDYSTGGGHGPEETLVEGDEKLVTRKWQGYPPRNLNLIGKPHPAMPQVGIPRLTGKAEYTTRIQLPNMLYTKLLTSPHPRAKVKSHGRFRGGKDAGRGSYPDAAERSEPPIRFLRSFSFKAKWWPS